MSHNECIIRMIKCYGSSGLPHLTPQHAVSFLDWARDLVVEIQVELSGSLSPPTGQGLGLLHPKKVLVI